MARHYPEAEVVVIALSCIGFGRVKPLPQR
jgi:hypothetical protein